MYASFTLFTNRNVIVFDSNGNQIPISCISCYHIDNIEVRQLINNCSKFYISKWGQWKEEITKLEIEYLLGLRTREEDLIDAQLKNKIIDITKKMSKEQK